MRTLQQTHTLHLLTNDPTNKSEDKPVGYPFNYSERIIIKFNVEREEKETHLSVTEGHLSIPHGILS